MSSVQNRHDQLLLRRLRKFLKKHPELRDRFTLVVDGLIADPFVPRLKYHQLSGKLQGLQAVSLTDSYRLVLTVRISGRKSFYSTSVDTTKCTDRGRRQPECQAKVHGRSVSLN